VTEPRPVSTLSTPAKLLLFLSLALLPIGGLLMFTSINGIRSANAAIDAAAVHETDLVAEALDALIARNVLTLRVAARSALEGGGAQACAEADRVLAAAPGTAHSLEIEDSTGQPLCNSEQFADLDRGPPAKSGEMLAWISPDAGSLFLRVGVDRGSATTRIALDELRQTVRGTSSQLQSALLSDGKLSMALVEQGAVGPGASIDHAHRALASKRLTLDTTSEIHRIGTIERLTILLPVLMWVLAALVSWWLVHRLLISPLRRLQAAVVELQPGDSGGLVLPDELGPAVEIRELSQAFARAVSRIEEGERAMGEALEGQRKLVREVHHRVKNNLQVVASMLSIHGRTAADSEARAAYSAIGRRVAALSVVHRNHYAELEENKGISLRPMLTELASELRGSAPERARSMPLDLEVAPLVTTQDAAVAAAFLVTEVVEYAMLHGDPARPVEIFLRRSSELTGELTLIAAILMEDRGAEDEPSERRQFERILDGLARQLRSPLDRKQGRYSVDLPIFPDQ
jgi:two-component sensor histidine kinase